MRSGKDFALILLALTTLAGGWLAWSQTRELRRLRAEPNPAAPAQSAAPVASDTASGSDPVLPGSAAPSEAVPAAAADRSRVEESRLARQEQMERLQDTPEYQQLRALQMKGALDHRYAALFRRLDLPPAKLDALKNLLLERQTVGMDVNAIARAQGLDPRRDGALLQQLITQTRDEINAGIRNLLGEETYRSYEFYEQTMPYRDVVNQLDLRLSYTSAPLTEAQAEQLVRIVAEANQDAPAPRGGAGVARVFDLRRLQAPLNDTAMDRARGILTPDQFPALEELQARQQASRRMGELMREGRNEASGALQPAVSIAPGGG